MRTSRGPRFGLGVSFGDSATRESAGFLPRAFAEGRGTFGSRGVEGVEMEGMWRGMGVGGGTGAGVGGRGACGVGGIVVSGAGCGALSGVSGDSSLIETEDACGWSAVSGFLEEERGEEGER